MVDTDLLASEQRALRRLAALVAGGATPDELFAAVAREAAQAADAQAATLARFEPDGSLTPLASVGTGDVHASAAHTVDIPLLVDGKAWGMLTVGTTAPKAPPDETEGRLHNVADLAVIAISTAESRDLGRRAAGEQAALRRVATLVGEGAPAAELFPALVTELVQALRLPAAALLRFDADRTATVLATANAPGMQIATRRVLADDPLGAQVFETGRPARVGNAVGVPIVVAARVWGMICAETHERTPPPADLESRVRDFSDLVATAIANADSRERLRRLADEQAALRRVATLVAEGAAPDELFAAVAREVDRLLDVSAVTVHRYQPDGTSVVVASLNARAFPVGSRWELDGPSLQATVFEAARPAQIDYSDLPGSVAAAARASGMQSAVGVPIVVDGTVWGIVAVGRRQPREAFPVFTGIYTGRIVLAAEPARETEARLAAFTELAATAISKAQANDDLQRLADEQAALRRVATLVAEGALPTEIFEAVAGEVARIFELPSVGIMRYAVDESFVVLATSGDHPFRVGTRWPLDGPSTFERVYRTGRPARIDDYADLPGSVAQAARKTGIVGGIGAPIVVDGVTWGVIAAPATAGRAIPEGAEVRLSQFTELVATAVSNASSRAELVASRARIVAAGDDARRRFERNLHDGTQQRLLALRLDLERIRRAIPEEDASLRAGLEEAERDLESVVDEVREVSRGLHPAELSRGGLKPAVRALASRSPIEVALDVELDVRPEPSLETAMYYVLSEALANATKHSQAAHISLTVRAADGVLRATIADDGVGGAVAGAGSGLTGLADRVNALGGRFVFESPRGRGTTISVELPVQPAAPS
jgi:signal transduction histidine kinase